MAGRLTGADIFDAFASVSGPSIHAIQLDRLRQIAAQRAIELGHGDPAAFVAKLAELSPEDQKYVLTRLAQGQPAAVKKQTPHGAIPQVWFPVALPGPQAVAAQAAALAANPPPTMAASDRGVNAISEGRTAAWPRVGVGLAYQLAP